jgi:hypothetical protein
MKHMWNSRDGVNYTLDTTVRFRLTNTESVSKLFTKTNHDSNTQSNRSVGLEIFESER